MDVFFLVYLNVNLLFCKLYFVMIEKNIYGVFCVHVRVLQTWRRVPLSKKIKDDLISQKYTRR